MNEMRMGGEWNIGMRMMEGEENSIEEKSIV
jgi:hypothetical protein